MDKANMILEAKNINLWFGAKQVLKQISVEFEKNNITALIGPSGCGKSTLLRCFNRMHDFNRNVKIEGQVLLNGENIFEKNTDPTVIRRKIGMVFQKPNPFPKSIFENISYGLKINNADKHSIYGQVEKALKDSYLWEEVKGELKKPAVQLSGGQQQRLCIARAVSLRPDIILMDEPCSALDPISTAKIEDLILELKKDFTVVIVTHNMQQAQRIADKTVFMYLGEVIEDGPTNSIFKDAKNKLTRRYVEGHFG